MVGYLHLFSEILIVVSLIFAALQIRHHCSQRNNEVKVLQWFEAMDVVSHEQRWRGERSRIIELLDMSKHLTGVDAKLLCVSKSGRWFVVHIQSRWGHVNSWRIELTDINAIAMHLDVTLEDITESWQSIQWTTEGSSGSQDSEKPPKPRPSSAAADKSASVDATAAATDLAKSPSRHKH